jgi:RNA polymerase sigma-70 factor (ECF subfamily)
MKPAGPPLQRAGHGWFDALWEANYEALLAYALRRAANADDAADVVSETFLTAWRRAADAPNGEQVRLWLFGIARRILANQQRGHRRRDRLTHRLQSAAPAAATTDSGGGVAEAFAQLRPEDRDLLTLVAVEGLTTAELATVCGCTHVTARVRLHRARARFARHLAAVGIKV